MLVLQEEARHFLAIAFSAFQLASDAHAIDGWDWTELLKALGDSILVAVSFNYDLILERSLAAASVPFQRVGIQDEDGKLVIVKPHGSIDFETVGITMSTVYPMDKVAARNNTPLRALAPHELLEPRTEVDVIAPQESSWLSEFQWVRPGYEYFSAVAPTLRRCIFVGLSYWPADRDEIDRLVGALHPSAEVIVANPAPPREFMDSLQARFRSVVVWPDGPQTP
jgi:hypothetical protein